MFIWSVKLNRNFLWGICAAVCMSIGAIALFTPKNTSFVLKNSANVRAETFEQQKELLHSFGYETESQPILIEEIVIPAEFDDQFEKYNDLQKISGFNLAKYKGHRAKKYTYNVINYPEQNDGVVANIIVYGGKVIGGDISSAKPDGFIHGFIKE